MADANDWYPSTIAGEREMFEAIAMNIIEVNNTLEMGLDKATRLLTMAQAYLAFSDNLPLNRAAVKSLGTDFSTMMHGNPASDPMPTSPVYFPLTLPVGNFVGMEAEVREMRRYMSGLFTWTEAMATF